MEKFTDSAFRTLCFNHGADLTFTEYASTDALAKGVKETWNLIKLRDPTPTAIQLLVGNEDNLKIFLKKFKPEEGFRGFNLNLGCPDPLIVKSGRGAGMVRRIAKTQRLISIIKKHNYPVSVKMRLGATKYEKNMKAYLNLINGTDPDFFIVHARSAEDNYVDNADYSVFEECALTGKEIIANGDIVSVKQIDELKATKVKGAMIGRAAVINPAIFDEFKGNRTPSFEELKNEYSLLADNLLSKPRHKRNVLMRIGSKN